MPTFIDYLKDEKKYMNEVFEDELEQQEINAYNNADNNGLYNVIKAYFDKEPNHRGKPALHHLANDFLAAYTKYLLNEWVDLSVFNSEDVVIAFNKAIRDSITEGLPQKFTALFELAGDNADKARDALPIK